MTAPQMTLQTVKLASGQSIEVQGHAEKTWFNRTRDKYLSEHKFTAGTDLQDVDRLLIMELMVYRWTTWMTSGYDYDKNVVTEDQFQKPLREYNTQITALKASMGLAKAERDRDSHDSVGAYIIRLKQRGKEFGVHREKQVNKALDLIMELSTLVGAFDRSDAIERAKIGIESEADIVEWVRSTMLPEFHSLDAEFRKKQRLWAGTL